MLTRKQAAAQRREILRQLERDHRRKMREKLAELRAQLSAARAARKALLSDASERCRAERIAARERARALRLRALAELREATRAERQAARSACIARKDEAKQSTSSPIERARAELGAERKYQEDLRRIERGNRASRLHRPKATRAERRSESDDEVRANIPAELVALFEQVKRGIKAGPRQSRTEAFLKYAEEHPAEVLHAVEDKTEALIRDLERQQNETRRALRRPVRFARPMPPTMEAAASDVPF
jgi:hypothetical protein